MTLGCNLCGGGAPTPDRLIPPGWTVLEVAPTRFLVACAECSARYQISVVRHEAGIAVAVTEDIEICVTDLWTGCSVHVEC